MVDDVANDSALANSGNGRPNPKPRGLDPAPLNLNAPLTERREAWEDNYKFLTSVRTKIFSSEELPSYEQRKIFIPQITNPSLRAGEIIFGLAEEASQPNAQTYLFIADVYHLIFRIWQASLNEETLIEQKQKIAEKNSSQDAENQEAWDKRSAGLASLLDTLRHEIRPLGAEFQDYYFGNGDEEISSETSVKLLAERKVQSHGGAFQSALDDLIKFANKLRIEAGLDVAELPEEVVLEEEKEVPVEVTTSAVDSTTLEVVAEPAADEEAAQEQGDNDNEQARQPERIRPPDEPRRPRAHDDLHTQATNNLKLITLETERLTRIYLASLATTYGLSPELLQVQNPMFRDMVREDVRSWIMEQLRAGKLDSLYDSTKIREHQMDMQLAIEHLKSTFRHDARFELFSDILFDEFKKANVDPTAQAAFKKELKEGKFIDPAVWDATFENFSQNFLTDSDGVSAFNPREALDAALDGPFLALSLQIQELGIVDLDLKGNSVIFNQKVINIVNLIDIMAFGNYPPLFLSSLGKSNFEATFKVKLTESEFRSLLPILETYWTVRVGYFSRNGIDLKIIGEGLDPDDVRDWFEKIPQSDSETFFRNYLARLEHFAQAGRDIGGFHRVILTMSRDKNDWKKGSKDTDGVDDPDVVSAEDETATKKLKLQVMQEALAFAWTQLPDEAKITIYNEIDPSQADKWLETNYFPSDISFNDLNKIAKYANELDLMSPANEATMDMGGEPGMEASGMPMASAAGGAINQINAARNKVAQIASYLNRRKKIIAKKAAKKAVEAGTKRTAETALNAIGSALGIPGVGTVLVNLWYSLPKELRPVVGMLLVAAPMAILAGLGGFIFSLLNGQAGAWALNAANSVGSFFKNLFGGKTSASQVGSGGSLATPGGITTNPAFNASAVTPQASTGAQIVQVIKGINPATQAVLITMGGTGAAAILNYMVVSYAFVANFPLPDFDPSTKEKISKYLSLEKAITLPAGCDQVSLKCPELAAGESYDVTYTITLTSKGNYVVSITEVLDEIVAKFSKKKFEELGRPVPASITITRVVITDATAGPRSDFPELSPDANDELNIIRPGEQVIITYVETYDSKFNHSQIANDFRADFYFVDGPNSGTDFVQTAKAICIGDCTQAEGCWPATGMDLQGPYESCSDCTHTVVDAYDIMDPHRHKAELENLGVDMSKVSNPAKIYSPFDGQACFPPPHSVYGNYIILSAGDWHYWLAHMTTRIGDSGCRDVSAGEILGIMGNTGTPGMGVHLHFELRTKEDSVSVGGEQLGPQMPPSLLNNQPPVEDIAGGKVDYVLSCYDED